MDEPITSKLKDDNDLEIVAENNLIPLTSKEPSFIEIKNLLQGWLDCKAQILAGKDCGINTVARERLVTRVNQERAVDIAAENIKKINSSISSLDIINRTLTRIEVKAMISYSDQTINRRGEIVEETKFNVIPVRYIFSNKINIWKLYEYIPGS